MAKWLVSVLLLAVAGTAVSDESLFTFPENLIDSRNSRIVSGWEATEGQIPHQLSLRMVSPAGGVSACGGSIISSEWGLTAAHCTATRVSIVVRAGAVNLTSPIYIFETTVYFNHPAYIEALQSIVQPNDIGLIKFGRSLDFSDYVKPVRLQGSLQKDRNFDGTRMVASGWGRLSSVSGSPEVMNWVFQSGISNTDCKTAYSGSSIIVDSTICTLYYNVTSQSTCQGDSGGPLTFVDYDGYITQVGVTSFVSARGCGAGMPAGFVRPSHYHEWFTTITGIDYDWDADYPDSEEEVTESPESPDLPESETTDAPETPEVPEVTAAPESDESSSSSSSESSESSSSSSSSEED